MISAWVFTPRQNWFMIDIYETFTPVNKPWPIGSVFVYELCGCEFKSRYSHLACVSFHMLELVTEPHATDCKICENFNREDRFNYAQQYQIKEYCLAWS